MENKKYIVAVLCTESLEEAKKWAARIAKKEEAVALIGEVIEEIRLEEKEKIKSKSFCFPQNAGC